jgi:hypothetical protein
MTSLQSSDDGQIRAGPSYLLDDFETVHVRQAQVQDN